ncbi:unnamed protein product [Amoebophrya sp. A120]|nr:unnamed protein product [Amoebophrya sp. A120]|eukprot:GSA120T00002371001.1
MHLRNLVHRVEIDHDVDLLQGEFSLVSMFVAAVNHERACEPNFDAMLTSIEAEGHDEFWEQVKHLWTLKEMMTEDDVDWQEGNTPASDDEEEEEAEEDNLDRPAIRE